MLCLYRRLHQYCERLREQRKAYLNYPMLLVYSRCFKHSEQGMLIVASSHPRRFHEHCGAIKNNTENLP